MAEIQLKNADRTRQRLLEQVLPLSFEELNQKPDSNTWSIAQVCEHIALAETSFAKAIRYGLKQEDNPYNHPKPIHVLSDRSQKVKAPDIVAPGEKPLELQEILDLLSNSRTLFLQVLEQVDDPSVLTKKTVPHPLFGDLPLHQWTELIYLHEDRHIEQIKEIKEKIQ